PINLAIAPPTTHASANPVLECRRDASGDPNSTKQSCHIIERPPSTASVAPVMNEASSLTRVHHAARRRGSRVAARGVRTAYAAHGPQRPDWQLRTSLRTKFPASREINREFC